MSVFNAEQFLQTSITETHDTKLIQVPDGLYKAQAKKVESKFFPGKDGKQDSHLLEISWVILDEAVTKLTGLKEPTVRQAIFLDLDNGKLATGAGKNIGLGKLREALNQNKPGKAWAPNHIIGGMATVSVKARENPNDGEKYAQVDKVAKLS